MANPSSAVRKVPPELPKQPPAPVARFEFMSAQYHPQRAAESDIFVKFAAEGWELVSVTESANYDRRYYFKRPL